MQTKIRQGKTMDKMKSLLRLMKNKMGTELYSLSKNGRAGHFLYKLIRSCYRMLLANYIIPKLQNEINSIAFRLEAVVSEQNAAIVERNAAIVERNAAIVCLLYTSDAADE